MIIFSCSKNILREFVLYCRIEKKLEGINFLIEINEDIDCRR